MAESLHLDVVAEGVETMDQLDMLRSMGCPNAQGFLMSRPVPVDAMPATVAALEGLPQWPAFRDAVAPGARSAEDHRRQAS